VDWGHLGSLAEDGGERKLWGFTITLGYSRMMMAEAPTDQKLGTLLRMHEAAFRQWGAVPAEILYDRMKTIWAGTDDRVRNPVEGDHDSGAKPIRIPAGSRSPIPEPSRSVIPG
jgi:transposase